MVDLARISMRRRPRKRIRLDAAGTALYKTAFDVCLRLYPDYFDVIDHRNIMAAIVRAMRNRIRTLANHPQVVSLGRKSPRPQTLNTPGELRHGNTR